MKTFNRIEFDGETITVHGIGALGYSESFDLDSVEAAGIACVRTRSELYMRSKRGDQTIKDYTDVVVRIIYAKNRLIPADRSFKQLMEV